MSSEGEDYELFLAQSFWPAFWGQWKRCKVRLTLLTIRSSYVQWRDRETDSILWFLKSFLRGLDIGYITLMLLFVAIAECGYLSVLSDVRKPMSNDLIGPLSGALPALLGSTLLDYLLEWRKKPRVGFVALFLLSCLGYATYWFGKANERDIIPFYFITVGVFFLSWCVKSRDRELLTERNGFDTASMIPKGDDERANHAPKTWNGKNVVTTRPQG